MDFLKDLIKEIGGEYVKLAKDIVEEETFVDTGSYLFNAVTSGSIFGGVSGNKITSIAGETSVGKTFFALAVVKNFLDTNPGAMCLYFDTESAVSRKLLEERGVDTSRTVVINLVTVEEFRNKALNAVELYMKKPEAERSPCLFVLDSLGMLSTTKEIEDTLNDKQVRDMTRAQLLKGTFRVLTLKLGLAKIPMIVTNHLYDVTGAYVPTKEQGGGSGLKFAATTIIYLSKKKEKDGTEVVGNIIKAKAVKSRLSRENRDVEVRLFYDERGLDRYYGLLPLAVEGGIIERVGNRYVFGEKKFYEKEIMKNPETFFTQDVLEQIDVYAQKKFKYGSSLTVENEEEETEE
jgi:RecA/RadA recombinase